MEAGQVLELLELLRSGGVESWVDGGWGVEALLGRQSRAHRDLDVVVDEEELSTVVAMLSAAGFVVFRDLMPTALALRHADGREVDLHPVRRTLDGGGDQPLPAPDPPFHYGPPTTGVIGGMPVRCVDAETQVRAHTGYPLREVDLLDMHALSRQHGVPLPPELEL